MIKFNTEICVSFFTQSDWCEKIPGIKPWWSFINLQIFNFGGTIKKNEFQGFLSFLINFNELLDFDPWIV